MADVADPTPTKLEDTDDSEQLSDVPTDEELEGDVSVETTSGKKKKKKKKKKKNQQSSVVSALNDESPIPEHSTSACITSHTTTEANTILMSEATVGSKDGRIDPQSAVVDNNKGSTPATNRDSSDISNTVKSPVVPINGSPSKHTPEKSRLRPMFKANKKNSRNVDKSDSSSSPPKADQSHGAPPLTTTASVTPSVQGGEPVKSLETNMDQETAKDVNKVGMTEEVKTEPLKDTGKILQPALGSTKAGSTTPKPPAATSHHLSPISAPSPTFSSDAHESDTSDEEYVGEFSTVVAVEPAPPTQPNKPLSSDTVPSAAVSTKDNEAPEVVTSKSNSDPVSLATSTSATLKNEGESDSKVKASTASPSSFGSVRSKASMFEKKSSPGSTSVGLFGRKSSSNSESPASRPSSVSNEPLVGASSSPLTAPSLAATKDKDAPSTPEKAITPSKLNDFMTRIPSGSLTPTSPSHRSAASPIPMTSSPPVLAKSNENKQTKAVDVDLNEAANKPVLVIEEEPQQEKTDTTEESKAKPEKYYLKLSDDENIEDVEDSGEAEPEIVTKEQQQRSNSRVQSLIKKHSQYFERKSSENTSSVVGGGVGSGGGNTKPLSKKVSSSPSWGSLQQKRRVDGKLPSTTTAPTTSGYLKATSVSTAHVPATAPTTPASTPTPSDSLDCSTSTPTTSADSTTSVSPSPSKLKPSYFPQRPSMVMDKKGSPNREQGKDGEEEIEDVTSSKKKRAEEEGEEAKQHAKSGIHALRARFLRSQSPSPRAVLRPNRKKLAVEESKVNAEFSNREEETTTAVVSSGDDDSDHDEGDDVVYTDPHEDLFHDNAFIGGGRTGRSGSRKRSIASKQLHHSHSFNEVAMAARDSNTVAPSPTVNDGDQGSDDNAKSLVKRNRAPAPFMRSASMGMKQLSDDPHTAFKKLQFNTAESQRLQEAHERVRRKMLNAASSNGVNTIPSFARNASQQAISLISSSEQDKIKQQRAMARAGIRSNNSSATNSPSKQKSSSLKQQPTPLALPNATSEEQPVTESRLVPVSSTPSTNGPRNNFNKALSKVAPPSAFRSQNQKKSVSGGGGMKSMSNFFGRNSQSTTATQRKQAQVYHEEDALAKYENNAQAYNDRLAALEAQKREYVKIEDYISAAAVKRQIDDLVMMIEDETRSRLLFSSVRAQPSSLQVRASIARLKVLEQAKRIAVEAEDYVKANILKSQIAELQTLILSKHDKPHSPPKSGGPGKYFGKGVSVHTNDGQRHRSRSGSNGKNGVRVKKANNQSGSTGSSSYYRSPKESSPVIKRTILRKTNASLYDETVANTSSASSIYEQGESYDADHDDLNSSRASAADEVSVGTGTRMLLIDNSDISIHSDSGVDPNASFSLRSNSNSSNQPSSSLAWESPLKREASKKETSVDPSKVGVSNRVARKNKQSSTQQSWNHIRDAVFSAKKNREKTEKEMLSDQGGVTAIMQNFGDVPKRKLSSSSASSATSSTSTLLGSRSGRPTLKNAASIKERLNNFRSQSQIDSGHSDNIHPGLEKRTSFSESRVDAELPSEENEPFWLKDFKAKHEGKPNAGAKKNNSTKDDTVLKRGSLSRLHKWNSCTNLGEEDRGMSLNRGMDYLNSNPEAQVNTTTPATFLRKSRSNKEGNNTSNNLKERILANKKKKKQEQEDYELVLKTSDRGAVVWDPASKRKILMRRPGSASPAISNHSSNNSNNNSPTASPAPFNAFSSKQNIQGTDSSAPPFQLVKLKSHKERPAPTPKPNSSFTKFMKEKQQTEQEKLAKRNPKVLTPSSLSDLSGSSLQSNSSILQIEDDNDDDDRSIHLSQASCADALTASLVLSAENKKDMVEHDAAFRKASIAVHAAQREENERTHSPSKLRERLSLSSTNQRASPSNYQVEDLDLDPNAQQVSRILSSGSVASTASHGSSTLGALPSPKNSLDNILSDLAQSPNKVSTAATANRLMKSKNKAKGSLLGRRSNSIGEHSGGDDSS